MTPEQLEEIPGIGEKTLERISVAVRHYFGHFEEGEEAPATEGEVGVAGAPEAEGIDEPAALTAAADTGTISEGESEIETPEAVAGSAEAELENSQEVLEEAEDGGLTSEELAVDNVPETDKEGTGDNEEGGA
jgi:N utilization substance protein A